jgi:hypothetical protein
VWEDAVPSDVGKELVCWGTEEEPLEVAPLAMAEPVGDITGVSTAPKLGDCDEPYLNGSSKHSLNLDLCWELLLKAMKRN